jgi:hypothetical protein
MARKSTDKAQLPDSLSQGDSIELADRAARRHPYVFISHDSRDADLAAAFENLLTDASGGVIQTFRSSDQSGKRGIEYGENWYAKIAQCLGEASDVVALLTPNSTGRPWLLFEAGWAVGRLNTQVFGIALGLPLSKAIIGPFAQFQNCEANEESLTGVVLQLIQRNPDARPREQAVRRQVNAFLEEIDPLISRRTGTTEEVAEEMNATTVAKLFEEVKVMFRDLSDRITQPSRGRTRRRFHPLMIEEVLHMTRQDSDPSTTWLLLAALFRDEVPVLTEPAMEVYRAYRAGSEAKIRRAQAQFRAVLNLARHSRFMVGDTDEKDWFMSLRHLPEMLEHFGVLGLHRTDRSVGSGEVESEPKATVTKAEEPKA